MKQDFWLNFHEEDFVPGVSEELIRKVELALEIKLPEPYLEVMRMQNGGDLRYNIYLPPPLTQEETESEHNCNEPFCKLEELDNPNGLCAPGHGINFVQGIELLLAFSPGGSQYWCFDYRACGPQGDPPIVYIDADWKREVQIAANSEEYFKYLVEEEE